MPASTSVERQRTRYRIGGPVCAVLMFTVATIVSSPAAVTRAGDFAQVQPGRAGSVVIDPFRTFTDCLAAAAHSDSRYPGIDPDEVNGCLEDHGIL